MVRSSVPNEFAPCKAREFKTVSDPGFHATDFGFQVLDSTQFVSGIWILDSNRLWDSGFFELYSGFQSSGFRIPHANFSLIPKILIPLHGATERATVHRRGFVEGGGGVGGGVGLG